MNGNHKSTWLAWCFASTILISAFLVFQVQPVISKTILPWFGGSPAVWTTCMLFFQVLLFAGYAYAHFLNRLRPAWQGVIHVVLIAAALAALPINPDPSWKPVGAANPTWQILLLLLSNVGVPYFLLSSTGPLIQAWFSRACGGRSPYRLYALSNAGSLAALLTYPFLVEPAWTTSTQGANWSLGFCVFALCCTVCALVSRHTPQSVQVPLDTEVEWNDADRMSPARNAWWLLLPALASVLLLATTNHVCQDVAVIPFLWVLPLSLYLLTFILCFDSDRWYSRRWYSIATVAVVLSISLMMKFWSYPPLLFQIGIFFAAMFVVCMLCHGELVRLKPSPQHLTSFYLMCAGGGALGGIAVAVVCPAIFANFFELYLALVAGFLLAVGTLVGEIRSGWLVAHRPWMLAGGVALFAGLLVVVHVQFAAAPQTDVAMQRNFYGVLSVTESESPPGLNMVHGRVVHGFQFADPERRHIPTKYYARETGVGIALERFPKDGPFRVGVIGLGAGTVATYGQPGDYYRFYEINPAVCELADRHFTFLQDSQATCEVILGDGRLSLEREQDQKFDVLIVDAFSGDAIPTHLLTREAFSIYVRHLTPHGVLAANISNTHVDLSGVFRRLSEHHSLETAQIVSDGDDNDASSAANWILATRDSRFFEDQVVAAAVSVESSVATDAPLWTDDYSNLLMILK